MESLEPQVLYKDTSSNPPPSIELQGKVLFTQVLGPIAADLVELEGALIDLIPAQTESTRSIIRHVFSAGGKRIRPALFLLCCRMLKQEGEHKIPVAALCEYVHTASLLHDDVVDSSTLRRNKPTANSVWGDQSAVLVGDLVYARACELMAETGHIEMVATFGSAIRQMSEGELLQLENVFDLSMNTQTYFDILHRKTGVLIGASCRAAGILALLEEEKKSALQELGNSLGIAFQLIDDALDYRSSTQEFGKPTLTDFKDGKVTYPIILLRELLPESQLTRLSKMLSGSNPLQEEELAFLHRLVVEHKTVEGTLELARSFTQKGLAALRDHFPESDGRAAIEKLGEFLVSRTF